MIILCIPIERVNDPRLEWYRMESIQSCDISRTISLMEIDRYIVHCYHKLLYNSFLFTYRMELICFWASIKWMQRKYRRFQRKSMPPFIWYPWPFSLPFSFSLWQFIRQPASIVYHSLVNVWKHNTYRVYKCQVWLYLVSGSCGPVHGSTDHSEWIWFCSESEIGTNAA